MISELQATDWFLFWFCWTSELPSFTSSSHRLEQLTGIKLVKTGQINLCVLLLQEHILHQLEASLTEEELRSLDQREELRQQQLQKQLSCSHLHIQVSTGVFARVGDHVTFCSALRTVSR